jgi:hypothetical protein
MYPAVNNAWDISAYDSVDIFVQIQGWFPGPLTPSLTYDLPINFFSSYQNVTEDPSTAGSSSAPPSPQFWTSLGTLTSLSHQSQQQYPTLSLVTITRPLGRYLRIGVEHSAFSSSFGGNFAGVTVNLQLYGIGRIGV